MIDAFATADNAKLPVYISPIPDEKAYSVDALSTPWTGLCLYLFPPTKILSEVLRKLASEPCRALLIAPFWPAQVWFWDLVYACTDAPRSLPPRSDLLRQPGKGRPVYDTFVERRDLHVWIIDSSKSTSSTFEPSPWLSSFLKRRHVAPKLFCQNNHFDGSFKQIVAFWLDTQPLFV